VTVFVSYSSRDRDAAKSLSQDLEDADEQVWMDQRLTGGDAWWRAILEQIRGCDVFIFALSQSAIESRPCQAELRYAQALGLPILPVQVGSVDSMQLNPLATVQAIDYRHPTPSTAMRLSVALHRERTRRQPLPEPLPEEPPVPFEYLIRLYATISSPDYLSPRDQAALVAQLRVALREDGQDEMARNNIVTLLRKLHDREDVAYQTRTDVEAILASIGSRPPTTSDTVVEPEQPHAVPQVSAPSPTDTGRESEDGDRATPEPATGNHPSIGRDDHRIPATNQVDEPNSPKALQDSLLRRLRRARTRTKIVLGAVAVLVISVLALGANWISKHPTTGAPTTSQPNIKRLPGTDDLGWIDHPRARCDPGTRPAAMARTTQSVLVVCEIQPGNFYYRGVRLSDNAGIELANVVRSSASFDVTDPTDGTKYRLRPTSLTIARPDAQVSSEPVLAYTSS
jgi:hypothetical protein